jgi:hypothetical protein
MADDPKGGQDPDSKYQDENDNDSEDKRAPIAIELTPNQIDRVILGATGAGNMSVLLSGQIDMKEMIARRSELLGDPSISRSLLRALLILAAMHEDENYIGVVELSNKLEMSPSTTHRYLSTFVLVGIVERNESSRKYRLAR